MLEFLVAADDRTGSLEVAGLSADVGAGSVLVTTDFSTIPTRPTAVTVVDLDSRHLGSSEAAIRAAAVPQVGRATAVGHKIDSTLRGNWHHEVVARSISTARRVLVVAAFPSLGRTCVDGVVRVHGIPVADGPAGRDALSPTRSSRPDDLLAAAGCDEVHQLRDATEVTGWASGVGRVAVCDARTDDDLRAIASAWRPFADDVLFVGAGAAVAAAVAATLAASGRTAEVEGAPRLEVPVLVVCGSLHPVARRQLEVLRAERPEIEILDSAPSIDGRGAREVATTLATEARARLADGGHRTLVLIGGDTAAATLGDGPVVVGGTLATGLPWLRRLDGSGPLILTRSGGFGDDRALVELFEEGVPR